MQFVQPSRVRVHGHPTDVVIPTTTFTSIPGERWSLSYDSKAYGVIDGGYDVALRTLSTAVASNVPAALHPTTILNPCCGVDGHAVRIFPNARMYIGVDLHPFSPMHEVVSEQPTYAYTIHSGFRWESHLDALAKRGCGMRGLLLGALSMAVPQFRLMNVHTFTTAETNARQLGTHGLITFDRGPGTCTQQYLYLNVSLTALRNDYHAWWYKLVRALRPSAAIIKGAMNAFYPAPGKFVFEQQPAVLRDSIIAWLRRSRGVLIEDTALDGIGWEFSGLRAFRGTRISVVGDPAYQRGDFTFGYHGPTKITYFDALPSTMPDVPLHLVRGPEVLMAG